MRGPCLHDVLGKGGGKGKGDVLVGKGAKCEGAGGRRGRPDASLLDFDAVYTAPGPADWF